MRAIVFRWAPRLVFVTLVLVVVLVFVPVERALVVEIYLLVASAFVLLAIVAVVMTAERPRASAFERALERPAPAAVVPDELRRLEAHVLLAQDSAFDLHFRLRPTLVEITDARLWRTRGVALERGEQHVPPRVWELVRPDREPPHDRLAAGISHDDLEAVVADLERM